MTIIDDYLKLTEKYSIEYGEKTILLMQVGSFFECYALVNSNNEYYGSHIKSFAEIKFTLWLDKLIHKHRNSLLKIICLKKI